MSITALEAIRQSGIVIASDGAEYHKIAEFNPIDATTNPSLVAAAVSKPEYIHILDEAVKYSVQLLPGGSIDAQTQLALDRLLVQVGLEILNIIPGRVSLSVDPRIGYDYEAIICKGRALISLVEELHISRSRILIKIPATYAGICAADTLENEGIQTNLTLIFSLVQALACAQAGISVISPFIGRVKDWWSAQAVARGEPDLSSQPLAEHPGIELVHRIRAAYTKYGYKTQIMAAGFRRAEEIVELSKGGRECGPDLVTLPPDLLDGLQHLPAPDSSEFPLHEEQRQEPRYFPGAEGEAAFTRDSRAEAISLDKVPEGIEKFSVDARLLEEKVRAQIQSLSEISTSPRVKRDGWSAH